MPRSASLLLLIVAGIGLAASLAVLANWLTGAPPPDAAHTEAHSEAPAAAKARESLPETARADAPPDTATPSLPDAPHPSTIRNVTPSGILPPPVISGPLKRVAGTETRPPPPEVPRELAFRRPLIIDAGTLRHKRLTLHLADIDAPELEETCPSRLGGDWPCGMRARTALRGFVRRQTLHCETETDADADVAAGHGAAGAPGASDTGTDGDTVTVRCRRGDSDLSLWLVRHGWARAGANAPAEIAEAAAAAREAKKGIWQLDGPAIPATRAPLPSPAGDGSRPPQLGLPGGEVEIIDTPWFPGAQAGDEEEASGADDGFGPKADTAAPFGDD